MGGASPALQRFRQSIDIGYEQWHDGIGYDLDALDEITEEEKREVEGALIPRVTSDWRDLEALEWLGTPRALEAIVSARGWSKADIRLYAHRYGPAASEAEWESAIVYGLSEMKSFADGLVLAFDSAVEHPTPRVREALWAIVRTPRHEGAYHAAEALCRIAGLIDEWDMTYRELFLRLVGPASDDREAAVRELERMTRYA